MKQKIPELFQEIIKVDDEHKLNMRRDVPDFILYKETRNRRAELQAAAGRLYGSGKGKEDGTTPTLA